MPSNFRLGWPTIQAHATASSNLTPSTNRPLVNLFSGARADRFELASASTTTLTISYDLGSQTKSVNFIAVMRANLLQKNSVTGIKIYGNSTNSKPVSPLWSVASFNTVTLMGPNKEDYFATFTETSAFRYWWLEFTNNGTATVYPCSKAIFGKALDLEREPRWSNQQPLVLSFTRENAWSRKPSYKASLILDPVPDSAVSTFISEIATTADVLTVVALDPLDYWANGSYGFHALITDHDVVPYFGADNSLSLTLEEQI